MLFLAPAAAWALFVLAIALVALLGVVAACRAAAGRAGIGSSRSRARWARRFGCCTRATAGRSSNGSRSRGFALLDASSGSRSCPLGWLARTLRPAPLRVRARRLARDVADVVRLRRVARREPLAAARGRRAGLGRGHRRLFRRPRASGATSSPRRSARARPGRACAGALLGVVAYGIALAWPRTLAGHAAHGDLPAGRAACRRGRDAGARRAERRGRPVRVLDEARRGTQGFERPAAGAWRRARSHRRAHLHAARGGARARAEGAPDAT